MTSGSAFRNPALVFAVLSCLWLLTSAALAPAALNITTRALGPAALALAPSALNATLNTTANVTQTYNFNATLYKTFLDTCKGVVIQYAVNPMVEKIFPFSKINKTQPYAFEADVVLVNAGYNELLAWELFFGFQYNEVIASAPGILFVDGSTTPGALVGNGTTVMGFDTPDLLTSIETAENLDLISANFTMTGTEFGVGPEQPIQYPLPNNITLTNPGYTCGLPYISENTTMLICCAENASAGASKNISFLPRYTGDITIYYDVMQAYDQNYDAQVTIHMDDPIGMIDHWNLTWDWNHGEFIDTMKGAQTLLQEQDDCVNGPAGVQYPGMDFSQVMSCQKTPTIVDLSQYDAASQNLPGCCRNGTLLPSVIDPAQDKSVFTLQVYKLLPYTKQDDLVPPYNWRFGEIQGGQSHYVCGNPRLVNPSEFYLSGLHYNSAVKSWQVTCNRTEIPVDAPHKCCVSFSGFYNTSVIPCPTCSCGCPTATMEPGNMVCNANPDVEAMLLPSYALLLPASNRTVIATALAKIDHLPQPDPMPCPDHCGATINWHIYSDYSKGFSARVTLFNWNPEPILPWELAVEFGKATAGYENVYSFNGTKITDYDNNKSRTVIVMHGKDGYNTEILGLDKGLIPGKLQSLLSFDKRKTPGINVGGGDGFPEHVWFNGDECRLPDIFPTSGARRSVKILSGGVLLVAALVVSLLVL